MTLSYVEFLTEEPKRMNDDEVHAGLMGRHMVCELYDGESVMAIYLVSKLHSYGLSVLFSNNAKFFLCCQYQSVNGHDIVFRWHNETIENLYINFRSVCLCVYAMYVVVLRSQPTILDNVRYQNNPGKFRIVF